jgi:L,D-transpeptidase ErfK/SrfK
MRGVLLLMLGALLIWVGVRSSGENAASPDSEQDSVVALLDGPGALDAVVDRRPAPQSRESDLTRWSDEGGATAETAPGQAAPSEAYGPSGGGSTGGLEPPSAREEPPYQPQDPVPVTVPAADPIESDPMPVSIPTPPADSSQFRLGAPGADPVELGEVLLGAWIDQDPGALEVRLNDGESPLSPGRRRLLASFWQAVVGSGEAAAAAAQDLEGSQDVTSAQLSMLRAAAEPGRGGPIPAAASRLDPLALAMRMVLLEDRADHAARERAWPMAARSCSDLLQLELEAPWPPHHAALATWATALNQAQAHHRLHPDGEWPSVDIEVMDGEGLTQVRQRLLRAHPKLKVCVGLLREVNDLGRYIHPGQPLRAPTDLPNVLVNLDARMLVYRHGTEAVGAWVIGIGKEGHDTPTGRFAVGEKIENPPWRPMGGAQFPFGHPDNPLGTRYLTWFKEGVKTTYGFHGTWEPAGVGKRVSLGCVRLTNGDVESLFELLPVGSEILVRQ